MVKQFDLVYKQSKDGKTGSTLLLVQALTKFKWMAVNEDMAVEQITAKTSKYISLYKLRDVTYNDFWQTDFEDKKKRAYQSVYLKPLCEDSVAVPPSSLHPISLSLPLSHLDKKLRVTLEKAPQ